MKMVGLCCYCGGPALRTCELCGKAVCREHVNRGGTCPGCTGRDLGPKPFDTGGERFL